MTVRYAPDHARQATNLPEHEAIYKQIHDMILFGRLRPGQPVTIMGLADTVGAGITPIREAMRRLTAEGALQALGNRRMCVPEPSAAQIEQVYFARFAVEPELARRAAAHAGPAAIKALEAIDDDIDAAIRHGSIEAYMEGNHRFHFALYDLARAPTLTKLAASLWLQIGPSLRVVGGRFGTSNLPDMHSETLSALRNQDGDAAASALRDDITQGRDLLAQSFTEARV
ncbi:MAG: GntR family transcriptional regulator [Pseudomonadota bacterium]